MKMKKLLVGVVGVGFILGSSVASAFIHIHRHYHMPKPVSKTWSNTTKTSTQKGGFHAGGGASMSGTSTTKNTKSYGSSKTSSSMAGISASGSSRSNKNRYGSSSSSHYTYFNGHKQQTAQRMHSRQSSTNVSTYHGSAHGHMSSWYNNTASKVSGKTKYKY